LPLFEVPWAAVIQPTLPSSKDLSWWRVWQGKPQPPLWTSLSPPTSNLKEFTCEFTSSWPPARVKAGPERQLMMPIRWIGYIRRHVWPQMGGTPKMRGIPQMGVIPKMSLKEFSECVCLQGKILVDFRSLRRVFLAYSEAPNSIPGKTSKFVVFIPMLIISPDFPMKLPIGHPWWSVC